MFRFLRRKDPEKNYVNKAIIGLGYGLVKSRDLILSEGFDPQGAMDILAVWIGQEIVKEMLAQNKITPQSSEKELIDKLLDEVRIAEELSIQHEDNTINVSIQNCLICPKRVGGYDLEGETACPVGGILLGAISYLKGKTPKLPKVNLKPAELCNLNFHLE